MLSDVTGGWHEANGLLALAAGPSSFSTGASGFCRPMRFLRSLNFCLSASVGPNIELKLFASRFVAPGNGVLAALSGAVLRRSPSLSDSAMRVRLGSLMCGVPVTLSLHLEVKWRLLASVRTNQATDNNSDSHLRGCVQLCETRTWLLLQTFHCNIIYSLYSCVNQAHPGPYLLISRQLKFPLFLSIAIMS